MDTLTFVFFALLSLELTGIIIIAILANKDKLAEEALSIIGKLVGISSDEDSE